MIAITLKSSPCFALLLAAAHIGAIILVFMRPFAMSHVLAVLLALSLAYSVMHYALRLHSGSIVSLTVGEKTCTFSTRAGNERSCTILGSTYVSPWLTVLNLKADGIPMQSAVIFPDAVDREEFRQLRVWLRWKYRGTTG